MKRMRRLLLAAALCLLLTAALSATAYAADIDIMFSDPSAIVGNTVSVNVYSTGNVAGVDMTIVYDTDYLSYTGCSGGLGNAAVQENGGSLHIVDYSASGAANLSLDLHFMTRAIGTTVLRPTACTASDAGGDDMSVEFTSHSSSVRITSASTNCDLSSLRVSPGELSPAFSSGTLNYSLTVPNTTETLYMAPTVSDSAASFSVNTNRLSVGMNTITITVTAGSGAEKVYTLYVTRLAAQTEEPDNTVDDEEVEVPFTVTAPDGSEMTVGTFEDFTVPAGFAAMEIEREKVTVPAIRSADGTQTAVWCRGNAKNPEGFYILGEDGSVSPMDVITVSGASFSVLDASLYTGDKPADCALGTVTVDARSYTAFVPAEVGDYAVLYAVGPQGKTGLYLYDTEEKTVQRFGIAGTLVPESTPEPSPTPEAPEPTEEADTDAQTIENLRWKLHLCRIAAAVLLTATVIMLVLLVRYAVIQDAKPKKRR